MYASLEDNSKKNKEAFWNSKDEVTEEASTQPLIVTKEQEKEKANRQEVMGTRMKRRYKIDTDHLLLVCKIKETPLAKQKIPLQKKHEKM